MKAKTGVVQLRSLEYFLTDRCCLRCQNCSASSPYLRDRNLPELSMFRRSLQALDGVLRSDQIKLLGGEPLLNPQICDFMEVAAKSGLFEKIRVATNGLLLERMDDRFWQLADTVEVSLYPSPAAPSAQTLADLEKRAALMGANLEINSIQQFMVCFVDACIEDAALVNCIFRLCAEAHAWSCHLLYHGRLYRCSRVHTLDRYLDVINVSHNDFTQEDGLEILNQDKSQLREAIAHYLSSDQPLKACNFCLGTSGRMETWRELTPAETKGKRLKPTRLFNHNLLVSPSEAMIRSDTLTWEAAAAWIKP